tara:strand:+ start:84 stop:353 length:270 start_codon:yes stop_codon:yes gene_type:complete
MEYKKNGFDIRCRVEGSGEYAEGLILWKSYGEDHYTLIGTIYKTTTMACGTTRDTTTWHHVKGASPINKKSWHEAAKDLYTVFRKKEAA